MPGDDLVAGESRARLREAFLELRTRRRDGDGDLELVGELPTHLAEPFLRAVARLADELQDDDRRRGWPVREGGELHAAVVMALLLRVSDPTGPDGAQP